MLAGPRAKIKAAAEENNLSLDSIEIVDVPHSHAAAEKAVALARSGKVKMLMKGKIHTEELLAPVVDTQTGLRTERRMSHVFALDVPTHPKTLLISDAAINIFPDLECKRCIVHNATDLGQALGVARPKVALLSVVKTVTPNIPSTPIRTLNAGTSRVRSRTSGAPLCSGHIHVLKFRDSTGKLTCINPRRGGSAL